LCGGVERLKEQKKMGKGGDKGTTTTPEKLEVYFLLHSSHHPFLFLHMIGFN
jgi:hypothetical protein